MLGQVVAGDLPADCGSHEMEARPVASDTVQVPPEARFVPLRFVSDPTDAAAECASGEDWWVMTQPRSCAALHKM